MRVGAPVYWYTSIQSGVMYNRIQSGVMYTIECIVYNRVLCVLVYKQK